MTSDAHEKLVEEVANKLSVCDAGNGGDSFPSDWMPEARAVLALIAERTKDTTDAMITASYEHERDTFGPTARGLKHSVIYEKMHTASALWPARDVGTDS